MESRITWYPPLDAVRGRNSRIEHDSPITVAELLTRLGAEEPRFGKFLAFGPRDTRARNVMVVKGEKVLYLADTVEPGDDLEILAMMDGG
jgi:sulfur carrier protein ThiS